MGQQTTMTSLPLQVRMGIRDHWDKKDGALQKSIEAVKDAWGYEVVITPEWRMLTAELDGLYEDKAVLVANVAIQTATWCRSLVELIGDPKFEKWSDELLEHMVPQGRLALILSVSKSEQPSTAWLSERHGFAVSLPKSAPPTRVEELCSIFKEQLLRSFEKPSQTTADKSTGAGEAESLATFVAVERPVTNRPEAIQRIPDPATLPRADVLLLKPPYHMIINSDGRLRTEIYCSHSPSLRFLADYMRRWCKANHHDIRQPPAVDINLRQSAFGLGLTHDFLLLEAEDKYRNMFSINATPILALVEGVLGYERVSVDGQLWTYRRDTELLPP